MVFLFITYVKQRFSKGGHLRSRIIFMPYVSQWYNVLGNFRRNPFVYERTVEAVSFRKIFPYFG